jgi:hypothetical protein
MIPVNDKQLMLGDGHKTANCCERRKDIRPPYLKLMLEISKWKSL